MMPFATQEHLKDAWEYGIKKVSAKTNPMNKYTVKGSQFEQPLLGSPVPAQAAAKLRMLNW